MVIRSRFRLFQTELAPQFGSQTGSGPEVGLELVAGRIGLGIENIAFPDYQVVSQMHLRQAGSSVQACLTPSAVGR